MSYLAPQTMPSPDSYYFAMTGKDATFDDLHCKTITVSPEVALINGGDNAPSRLVLGPAPDKINGNFDYCSIIEANNDDADNYSSDLRFYTHGNAATYGMPTEQMRIDFEGNVTMNNNLAVAGTITSSNGEAVLNAVTGYTVELTQAALPNPVPGGVSTYNIGAPITVPRSGMYLLTGQVGYDGSPGQAFTPGGSQDFVAIRLDATLPNISQGVNITLVPCANGNDRVSASTVMVPLVAGVTYTPLAILYNESGSIGYTGTPNVTAGYSLAALC